MARKSPATDEWLEDAEAISDDGERVSHLVKDFTFYGHLSIYDFATQFCRDAVVLDAGSGAGYGAALVADAGARHVLGVDVGPKAVEFSRHHYRRPNLEFEVLDFDELALPPDTFDFIFTSNTLEHVADVPAFLRAAHASLKPAGAMLVAVPPITDDRLVYLNVINPYHVNIWSPRQWEFALSRFFGEVDAYLHGVSDHAARHSIGSADDHTPLSEKEFAFTRAAVDDMYTTSTLTAIVIARAPRPADALPDGSAPLGFVDDSLSRRPGQIDPELEARLEPYFDEPAGRATAPAGSPAAVRRRSGLARRAWFVWRTAGSRAFVHKTFEVLGRRW
jgi:SAM-dependent methyltransferase